MKDDDIPTYLKLYRDERNLPKAVDGKYEVMVPPKTAGPGPCRHCRAGKHYVCWLTPCECAVCDEAGC